MKSRPFTVVAVVLAVLLGASALWVAVGLVLPGTGDRSLRPEDPGVLAAGKVLYSRHCASCHGDQMQGQPNWRTRGADGRWPAPPHDASGHTWHHPDELLFRITKFGAASVAGQKNYASAMPIYEGVLSDEEIVAVLSWIKAQWPPEVRAKHDQMNARARQ